MFISIIFCISEILSLFAFISQRRLSISLISLSLIGCNNNSSVEEPIILNVYNCADYIAETEEDVVGVVDQFEQYCLDTLGKVVEVNYSTYETNEDMFNQLKAGGVQYDLVCPSEYMIDKLIQNDMLEKLSGDTFVTMQLEPSKEEKQFSLGHAQKVKRIPGAIFKER